MNKVLITVLIIFGVFTDLDAQIATSSPYSRFGLGELYNNIFPETNALGGVSTALSSESSINPNNPATYSYFGPNLFLFSTGGWHQTTRMETTSAQQIANNNGFSHIVLGFPLWENSGASIGMIPFSGIGYEISDYLVDKNDPLHTATANYYGDGGISKIYFGGGYEIFKGFSIGVNASYLFGGINRRKQLVYDNESFFNSRSNSKISLKGYFYELGLLYSKDLNQKDGFSIGIRANNNSSIRGNKSELVESFEFLGVIEVPKDTVINSIEWGEITLPRYISCGISYNKDKEWLFLADYSIQNWSDYSMFNESDDLVNSMKISCGIQYTPEYNSINHYYKRIDYRFGGYYSNTPLQFGGDQINEMAISFGFGIPLRKARTKYNFSVILGQRGTIDNNMIKEQFVRLGLSISYDGIWFLKRKYD